MVVVVSTNVDSSHKQRENDIGLVSYLPIYREAKVVREVMCVGYLEMYEHPTKESEIPKNIPSGE